MVIEIVYLPIENGNFPVRDVSSFTRPGSIPSRCGRLQHREYDFRALDVGDTRPRGWKIPMKHGGLTMGKSSNDSGWIFQPQQ